jgi:phosphoethanolamine N-methyltransferase
MTDHPVATQQWLDTHQYTIDSIKDYECVFGEDFVSPGGRELAATLTATLALVPGQHVLDVGCGLGGSAFLMAERYQVKVTGIDLSENMLSLARQKLARNQLQELVSLEKNDCLAISSCNQFDVVYSRDAFLHIADKRLLFKVLHRALQHDGRLLFTDYACGPKPWHDEFNDYVDARGYQLHTVNEYTELIAQAGFRTVIVEDWTCLFIDLLHHDLDTIQTLEVDDTRKQSLARSWQSKIARAQGGDHRWIKASARAARS